MSQIVTDLRQALYTNACTWLERGIDLVPVRPRSKKLFPGYGPSLRRIDNARSAHRWFMQKSANLGVVLGGEMGLTVADWDTVRDYITWRAKVGHSVATLAERTGRGYHLFFFVSDLPSAEGDGCEFKTSGVCTVSPSVHPTGVIYRIVDDAPILRIDEERALALFPFLSEALRKKERVGLKTDAARRVVENRQVGKTGGKCVIVRIKEARSIVSEMDATGVELRPGGTDTLVGLCPFHDDHSPSLWVYPHSGLWGCNKPSCSAAGIHDVINFRALSRGISNSMAIRQLADEFL